MLNTTFMDVARANKEDRAKLLVEQHILGFISETYLDYFNGDLVDDYREFAIVINEDLNITRDLILSTLSDLLDVSYQFKVVNARFSNYKLVKVRISDTYLEALFANNIEEE